MGRKRKVMMEGGRILYLGGLMFGHGSLLVLLFAVIYLLDIDV
jgi:hypothetical protein